MIEPWTVKVDRAAEHIGELRRSIGELKASGDLAAVTDQQGSERVVRLVARGEPAPRLTAVDDPVAYVPEQPCQDPWRMRSVGGR